MSGQTNMKLPFSKAEAKSDTTTRVARQIIDGEVAARDAKTDRLRAARIAREALEEKEAAPPKVKKTAKAKAAPKAAAKTAKTPKAPKSAKVAAPEA